MPQGDPRLRGDDKMVAEMTWGRSEGEASPFGKRVSKTRNMSR